MVEVTFSMLFTVACISNSIAFVQQQGVWHVTYGTDQLLGFPKTMYNGTKISVKISCRSEMNYTRLRIRWVMRYSMCVNEYESAELYPVLLQSYLDKPEFVPYQGMEYKNVEYIKSSYEYDCDGRSFWLQDYMEATPVIENAVNAASEDYMEATPVIENAVNATSEDYMEATPVIENAVNATSEDENATQSAEKELVPDKLSRKTREDVIHLDATDSVSKIDPFIVVKTWKDGPYIFILSIQPLYDIKADVTVRMLGPYGYISAVEWPLLVFYGVMGLVYIVYGLVWIVLLACNRKDLLSVHYWIGGVIFIGILEKAVFFAEYQSINYTGESVTPGALIVAEIISCLSRATAKMLVITISLGFGIVKPRPTLHKVLCIGLLYFVAGTVEGCMRSLNPKIYQDRNVLLAVVPLISFDVCIIYFILSSLCQTTRTLRLHEDVIKLRMFRRFTFTLIFIVFAGFIFLTWSFVQIKFKDCAKDWQMLWLDEAIWQLLHSIILIIIMILWRPTANNQSDLACHASSSHELLICQPTPNPNTP